MKPQSPKKSGETYSTVELRGIIPSDFVGIVRLTDFNSLSFLNLSLTNKLF
jgi:hypothetical protein